VTVDATGVRALVAGATAPVTVDTTGARAPAAGVCVPELELTALVTGVRALAALAAWGVAAAAAAELLELGPVPEPAAVASCAAGVTVEVTAEAADAVTEVTVLATGLEAGGGVVAAEAAGALGGGVVAAEAAGALGGGVLAAEAAEAAGALGGGVLAAEAAGALGGGVLGESAGVVAAVVPCAADVTVEEAAELTAAVADVTVELAADVTEEVVEVTAEVSVLVTGEAAGPEVAAVEGAVEACACRENTSKTSRIPAASIAHCAALRAARRKASCGIGGSPPKGDWARHSCPSLANPTDCGSTFSICSLLQPLKTGHFRHIHPRALPMQIFCAPARSGMRSPALRIKHSQVTCPLAALRP
jgi:hypothetical protein